MGTKNFNFIDKVISWMRLVTVKPFIQSNDELLDIGCGYQAYLLEHVKNKIKKGVGIDYDADETRVIAPQIILKKYAFTKKLPFETSSFSKITMLAVIEHIPIPKVAVLFKELARVLKPGGFIIITTPTLFGKYVLEFFAFKLHMISEEEVGDHKKYYRKEDFEELADLHGLKVVQYKTFQFGGNSVCVFKK